jgi:hypothetical protein
VNESQHTQIFLTQLRADPNLVVFKHCDRFTKDIPDASVTGYHRTTWLEFKAPPAKVDLIRYIGESLSQLHTMCRLAKADRAFYITWRKKQVALWHPVTLMNYVRTGTPEDQIRYHDVVIWDELMVLLHQSDRLPLRWPTEKLNEIIRLFKE